MNRSWFGIAALLPLMVGTSPAIAGGGHRTGARPGRELVAPLCGGGFVTIRLGGNRPPLQPPCPIKGCHAGCTRRFFDPEQ